MKILYIQGAFPQLSEAFLLDQIVTLIEAGHDVEIIASQRAYQPKVHPDIKRFKLDETTRCMELPQQRWLQVVKAIWLVLTNFHKAPRLIARSLNFRAYDCPNLDIYLRVIYATILLATTKNSAYDIIHCHLGYVGIMGVALTKIGVLKGKIITTFTSADAYVYPHKWQHNVYKSLWEDGGINIAFTNYFANTIQALGARPSTVRVLPLGLNLTKFVFKERALGADKTVRLVTVARLVEKKGLEYSIRAVSEVCKANPDLALTYTIAGGGILLPHLTQLIAELGMQERIQLLGWQDHAEITRLLADAHIFVFPSVTAKDGNKESQGVALQEAQAVGLPVITTIHNGLPEGMLDKQSGFLVPEKDVAALAERIHYLATHPEVWPSMGAAGRAFIQDKYEINKINDRLIRIFDELMGKADSTT
jgi:colanic acid/amylovoran biosynthesis glycosyltransferase